MIGWIQKVNCNIETNDKPQKLWTPNSNWNRKLKIKVNMFWDYLHENYFICSFSMGFFEKHKMYKVKDLTERAKTLKINTIEGKESIKEEWNYNCFTNSQSISSQNWEGSHIPYRSSRPEALERLKKRLSENMQQIYRRAQMPKSDFNKVALHKSQLGMAVLL